MVPVDYHIADTDLEYRFDLDQFVEKIQYVAKEWNRTKDKSKDLGKEKYIAPYFCFIQSSGMGKTKLMYEFAKLTRKDSSDDHEGASNVSKDFSCDLILSSAGILVNNSNVFDLKIELRDLLRQDSNQGATDVANKIYECLEDELVTKRSTVREMKKTHVFLFDEAQELLETHYGFQAFLFRCIRTWLRKKRGRKKQGRTTVIAVFSGTSSAILNYTVKTDLLKDDDLKPVSPSRDSQSNQNDLYYYFRGSKTFEPFFTLTTMAVLKPKKEIQYLSDYDKSIRYGRPLFAKMHENEVLDEKLETVLRRLLLHTGEEGFDLTQHAESWLSVVATRVQMGCIKLDVVSKLVSKGYANLTGVSSNFATFIYMPDPVCARLAMCMMDDEWRLSEHQGKSKEWWSAAVKTLYSTGLCLPDKGDLGEVLTALYFLFCGDACRKNLDDNLDYKRFSVPLEDWIGSLQLSSEDADAAIEKQSHSCSPGKPKSEPSKIFINFIQVCRDYLRAPWIGLSNQVYLKNLYDAGTAFYTYPGCDLIDFVAPTIISDTTGNKKPTYSAVLVSIKSRLYFSPNKAKKLCCDLKDKADKSQLKSALCIVCVFGQTMKSDDKDYTYNASQMLRDLNDGRNVATVLRIPRNDRFGLTDIFIDMTTTPEQSELLSAHSFLRAWGQKLQANLALRWYDENKPREGVNVYEKLTKDLYPEKENQ
jgi:hypothetical protein